MTLNDLAQDRWNAVRLSISIQHTPKRDDDPVYQRLVSDVPEAKVVTDPDPQSDYASTWRTYRECLRSTPAPATHRLVLQDDVQVCRNFVRGVEAAVKAYPDDLLSFFISHAPPYSAVANSHAWEAGDAWSVLDTREWTPTQALCWPVWMIAPLLRYTDRNPLNGTYVADDQVVSGFMRAKSLIGLASVPSLVEHVHAETTTLNDMDQVVNRVGRHRYALNCWFGAEGQTEYDPAIDIDWTRGPDWV
jgi:hypothetical protein